MVERRGEGGNIKKVTCWNNTEENKNRHGGMKNRANKAISREMGEKAEERHTELRNCQN